MHDPIRHPEGRTSARDLARTSALLERWSGGESGAGDALFERLYDELRRLAAHNLQTEHPHHTLQATDLAHEAIARLWSDRAIAWNGRSHLVGRAGWIMRRLLVDHARSRGRQKRGGDRLRVTLDEPRLGACGLPPDVDRIDLDAALDELEALDSTKARLVELRFFAGATIDEAAAQLDLSRTVAVRQWRMTRAWLRRRLRASP